MYWEHGAVLVAVVLGFLLACAADRWDRGPQRPKR